MKRPQNEQVGRRSVGSVFPSLFTSRAGLRESGSLTHQLSAQRKAGWILSCGLAREDDWYRPGGVNHLTPEKKTWTATVQAEGTYEQSGRDAGWETLRHQQACDTYVS